MEEAEEVEEDPEPAEEQRVARPQEEEEMRNSSEPNHPPLTEIAKTSIDSCRISRDTCR